MKFRIETLDLNKAVSSRDFCFIYGENKGTFNQFLRRMAQFIPKPSDTIMDKVNENNYIDFFVAHAFFI